MEENRKITLGRMIRLSAVIFNPVLVQLAGICCAVAASRDLLTALVFSISFSLVTLVTCFAASALLRNVPRYLRVAVYFIIGIAVIIPVILLLERFHIYAGSEYKIYLPMLAVNSATVLHCEKFAVTHKVRESMFDAIAVCTGFAAVVLAAGAVREILGCGTILGKNLGFSFTLGALTHPLGGFLVLGFFAAFLKWYISRFIPEFLPFTTASPREHVISIRENEEAEK